VHIYLVKSLWHDCLDGQAARTGTMGKAGKALRQVLEIYGISQNKLAVALGIERGSVYRWVHEIRDPTAETVREIVKTLQEIEPPAASKFIELYLGDLIEDKEQP